jgi:hypothetical protein
MSEKGSRGGVAAETSIGRDNWFYTFITCYLPTDLGTYFQLQGEYAYMWSEPLDKGGPHYHIVYFGILQNFTREDEESVDGKRCQRHLS